MTMHVGSVLGDAGRINDEFMDFLVTLNQISDVWHDQLISKSDGVLDIVFRTEGKLLPLDFDGIRTGSFWGKRRTLQIQIAMSVEAMTSPSLIRLVVESLRAATELGKTLFTKKGIPFCLETHFALIEKIHQELIVRRSHGQL